MCYVAGVGLLSKAKDAAIEQAILKVAAPKFERYGQLLRFCLDSGERTFSAEMMLHGETSPVSIPHGKYRIDEQGGQTFIVLYEIRISREWAQRILDDHAPEIRLKAPDFVRSLLG